MTHLTEHNLHSIEDMIKLWLTDYRIAQNVGKYQSVISRLFEVHPRATFVASKVILARAKIHSDASSGHERIVLWSELDRFIVSEVKQHHSAEQVAGRWIQQQKLKGITETLSKDTVYAFVYEHYPSLIKQYFRRKWKKYRNRIKEKADGKYQLQQRRMIYERDKRFPKMHKRDKHGWRKEAGHWEGDTVIGVGHASAIATYVERKSGYLIMKKLALGKNAEGMLNVFKDQIAPEIPKHIRVTLTFDNGRENAEHRLMEFHTGFTVYFAHPYHSWERGTNENTNGLIREYFPKGTDFNTVTEEELEKVQKQINMRPRKRLNYRTPFEMFQSY